MYIKLGYSPNESWDPDNSKYVWQHGSVEKKKPIKIKLNIDMAVSLHHNLPIF